MQDVNCKKLDGSIEILSSLMLICIIGIMLLYGIRIKEIGLYQQRIKDNLDIACLSAALIDTEKYKNNGEIEITDFDLLIRNFKKCFMTNMNLNENMYFNNNNRLEKVTIHKLLCFNIIEKNKMTVCEMNQDYSYRKYETIYDENCFTPDGKKIVSPTIYADVGMNIKDFYGREHYVHVTSCVDVVKRKD